MTTTTHTYGLDSDLNDRVEEESNKSCFNLVKLGKNYDNVELSKAS
jgi:hypothetical protein